MVYNLRFTDIRKEAVNMSDKNPKHPLKKKQGKVKHDKKKHIYE